MESLNKMIFRSWRNMKKKIAYLDIFMPLILLGVLLFAKLSDNTVVLLIISGLIGWVIPFFITIISGIIILKDTHQRLGIIANFLSIILTIILIIFVIRLIELKMIIFLVEYSILLLLNIINFLYFKKYRKDHPDAKALEKKEIKEKKAKNNGAIV